LSNNNEFATVAFSKNFQELNRPTNEKMNYSTTQEKKKRELQLYALFGFKVLKFNSHHINVTANIWSTKCILIA
jgi:hypothetical protein